MIFCILWYIGLNQLKLLRIKHHYCNALAIFYTSCLEEVRKKYYYVKIMLVIFKFIFTFWYKKNYRTTQFNKNTYSSYHGLRPMYSKLLLKILAIIELYLTYHFIDKNRATLLMVLNSK
jgi:hypothetical protein